MPRGLWGEGAGRAGTLFECVGLSQSDIGGGESVLEGFL